MTFIKGSAADLLRRLKSLFPRRWANDTAPVRDAVFGGIGDSLAWLYSQQQAVKSGTRRSGAAGYLLDLDAYGFFRDRLLRRKGETDVAWRKRYTDEIFRPRVTRAAIDKALFDLTGRHPVIAEPWNGGDAGGYGVGGLGYGGGNPNAGLSGGYSAPIGGYGVGSDAYFISSGASGTSGGGGFYGSLAFPYQIFITAFRPMSAGIPSVAGYGVGQAGYGQGAIEYGDLAVVQTGVSDAEIYACVARTAGAGITTWVAIQN